MTVTERLVRAVIMSCPQQKAGATVAAAKEEAETSNLGEIS